MYLICNHKNKLSYNEVKEYSEKLKEIDVSKLDFIIIPSLPYIYNFIDYTLGSQDISLYESETITGEVTGRQLKSLLIKYVLIGHAERRNYLNETIEVLKRKIENANKNDIKVIYCFTDEGNNLYESLEILKKDFESVRDVLMNNSLIAYEPQWAIGNNKKLDYAYINEVIKYLKKITGKDIIYGGSVSDESVEELLKIENICGFLISSSSLNINKLQNIVTKIS